MGAINGILMGVYAVVYPANMFCPQCLLIAYTAYN